MRDAIARRKGGFTLVELLVVIAILALLVSLILVASADGVRRAEERGTQALITKLETAVNDRIDALLNTQPPINQTHRLLAAINAPNPNFNNAYLPIGNTTSNSEDRRAQVIAQFDYLRAELPDVFFVNLLAKDGTSATASAYPLNFAGAPYPSGKDTLSSGNQSAAISNDGGSWALPLGNNYPGLPLNVTNGLVITQPQLATTGMCGASFSAAASVYKNLYTAAASDLSAATPGSTVNFGPGIDGVDNNGDGLIDELISPTAGGSEIVVAGATIQAFAASVSARLGKHTHKTARAEMLYALLVDGLSPLGSAFSREDFTAREVQDTDGDGMPEFVDAWGEPLQFFRWPIYYGTAAGQFPLGTSDSQIGWSQYTNASQARQQDPLDANQLLVSPGWWSNLANPSLTLGALSFSPPHSSASPSTNNAGPGAIAFMNYFHLLVDPNSQNAQSGSGVLWDRGGKFNRREFFTKPLILSAGPDREPGVAQFAKDYSLLVDPSYFTLSGGYQVPFPAGQSMEANALMLIYIENQAAVSDPVWRLNNGSSGSFFETTAPYTGVTASQYLSTSANVDDITNHNISGISTGVR